jgi:hypothetical protein
MPNRLVVTCIALLSVSQYVKIQAAPIDTVFVHGLAGFGSDELGMS